MPKPGTDVPWVEGAREVWLVGHRHPVPLNPPMAAVAEEAEHAVLCIDDEALVDITRRQYDPESPVPVIYEPIEEAGRHWRWFINGSDPDGERMPLRDVSAG